MAHFAQLNENNIVVQVIVVSNNDILDSEGNESEAKGIAFCQSLFGAETRWVQTSYNGSFRLRYATLDGEYDEDRDAFINPQPYPSWTLHSETLAWEAPIPIEPGKPFWDEENQQWFGSGEP